MIQLEEAICPLCSCERTRTCYRFEPYRVVSCRRCGFVYLSPRLSEESMQEYYRANYFGGASTAIGAYDDYRRQRPALGLTFARLIQTILGLGVGRDSLLEIGCGYGYLLAEASPHFRQLIGTDYSAEALEQVEAPARLVLGGLEELPEDLSVDVGVATHVLEHTYRPVEFVSKLKGCVRPGGAVVLAVPDYNSPVRWLMQRYWPSFKVPEHTLYFTGPTLLTTMNRAGLQGCQIVSYPHAFPLSLIASKFRVKLPECLGKIILWIPTTTVAAIGWVP